MSKPNYLSLLGKAIQTNVVKHGPEILTGLAVASMLGAVVCAIEETPKALKLIEEEKEAQGVEKLTAVDTVKTTWKCYIPTMAMVTLSAACSIGAHKVQARRTAALVTAYTLAETALTEYKDAVIETIGEKKEKDIREKVAEKQVEKADMSQVIVTGKGETYCLEPITGRVFKSDMEELRRINNDVNVTLIDDNYISLSNVFNMLGLEPTDISSEMGWSVEWLSNRTMRWDYHPILKDGVPCIAIDYGVLPNYDFDRFAY